MADPGRLRITIEVQDYGGEDDYLKILNALLSIGAEVLEEEEV